MRILGKRNQTLLKKASHIKTLSKLDIIDDDDDDDDDDKDP